MAKVFISDTYLTNIADAIRVKNNTNTTYTPAQMATAINSLSLEQHLPVRIEIIQSEHQTIKVVPTVNPITISENSTINFPTVSLSATVTADEGYTPGTLNQSLVNAEWGDTVTFSATEANATLSKKEFYLFTGKILENTGATYGETYNNETADYMHMQMMPIYLCDQNYNNIHELTVTTNNNLECYIGTFGLWNEENEHIIDGSAGMAIYSNIPRFVSGTAERRYDLESEAEYGDPAIEDVVNDSPSYWSGYDVPEDLGALDYHLDPLILGNGTVVIKTLSQFEEAINIIIGNSANLSYFDDYNMTNPHVDDFIFGLSQQIHLIKVEENTFYDSSLTRDQNFLEACKRLHEGIMHEYYIPSGFLVVEKGDTVNCSISFSVSPTSAASVWSGDNALTIGVAGTGFKLAPGETVTRRIGPVGTQYDNTLPVIEEWTWSRDHIKGTVAEPISFALSLSKNDGSYTIYLRYRDTGAAASCSYSGTVGEESVSGNAYGSIQLTGYIGDSFNITLSNLPQGYRADRNNVQGTLNNRGITVMFVATGSGPDPVIIE